MKTNPNNLEALTECSLYMSINIEYISSDKEKESNIKKSLVMINKVLNEKPNYVRALIYKGIIYEFIQ